MKETLFFLYILLVGIAAVNGHTPGSTPTPEQATQRSYSPTEARE